MLNLEDRIKKFNEMMNKYIPTEFINWLEYNNTTTPLAIRIVCTRFIKSRPYP
jgi:hypothetical protein